MTIYTTHLLKWYNKNKRDLPWRRTGDPYKIWLSEVILQQTRVDQGMDYYLRFVKAFPDIHSLAGARQEKVIKLWQGLGYYSRARNLHATAKEVVRKFNGRIPDKYEDIIRLKGIGDYTASAILSIAYNKPFVVVDGNVIRFISRTFGITKSVHLSSVQNEIKSKAGKLLPEAMAGTFNQAMMEFGALQCVPQNPDCNSCCFKNDCVAFRKNLVSKIPAKDTSVKIKNRYLNYFLVKVKSENTQILYLRKRTFNDIWKNMYDLPCIESKRNVGFSKLKEDKEWKKIFGKSQVILNSKSKTYTHKLSHQMLFVVFYTIEITGALKSFKEIEISQLNKFPVPRLIENYFTDQNLLK